MADVQAIYPLNFTQQALLFHHLQSDIDQGFLQVKCLFKGVPKIELLEQAWSHICQMHPSLRSSIHWEKIEKPVRVVHRSVNYEWKHLNWRNTNPTEVERLRKELLANDRSENIDLTRTPPGRLSLITMEDHTSELIWSCHHILLDGWSSATILEDFINTYEILSNEGQLLQANPNANYNTFITEIQERNVANKEATDYWTTQLDNRPDQRIRNQSTSDNAKTSDYSFSKIQEKLSSADTERVLLKAREFKISPSTLFHAIWGVITTKLLGSDDVVIGSTVSGRSINVDGMNRMSGMFANVLPLRIILDSDYGLPEFLQNIQKTQSTAQLYDYMTIDQISKLTGQDDDVDFFDSIVVFENFPWSGLKGGGLELMKYESEITSVYPLTFVIEPGNELSISIKFNTSIIDEATAKWIMACVKSLINNLESSSTGQWVKDLVTPPIVTPEKHIHKETINGYTRAWETREFNTPKDTVELGLTRIWEEVLSMQPIGSHVNFFEIGGKSIQVLQLFSKIENTFGRKLSPITILEHGTISSLANLIRTDNGTQPWTSLVPLRSAGNKIPLFCIHAGGGHIFFYQSLAKHLGSDQPVYALQPLGMDDVDACHQSIEEMSTHYLNEILSVAPEGPVALLGTCFSNPVCIEIAGRLSAMQREVTLTAIIDSPPNHLVKMNTPDLLQRSLTFGNLIKDQKWRTIGDKLHWYIIHPTIKRVKYLLMSKHERHLEKLKSILHEVAVKYQWKKFDGTITLIRSSEFHNRKELDTHILDWQQVGKELIIKVIDGHHKTLFDEPEVKILAQELSKCMSENQNG